MIRLLRMFSEVSLKGQQTTIDYYVLKNFCISMSNGLLIVSDKIISLRFQLAINRICTYSRCLRNIVCYVSESSWQLFV